MVRKWHVNVWSSKKVSLNPATGLGCGFQILKVGKAMFTKNSVIIDTGYKETRLWDPCHQYNTGTFPLFPSLHSTAGRRLPHPSP